VFVSDSKAVASGDCIYAWKPDAGISHHFVMQIYLHSSLTSQIVWCLYIISSLWKLGFLLYFWFYVGREA